MRARAMRSMVDISSLPLSCCVVSFSCARRVVAVIDQLMRDPAPLALALAGTTLTVTMALSLNGRRRRNRRALGLWTMLRRVCVCEVHCYGLVVRMCARRQRQPVEPAARPDPRDDDRSPRRCAG